MMDARTDPDWPQDDSDYLPTQRVNPEERWASVHQLGAFTSEAAYTGEWRELADDFDNTVFLDRAKAALGERDEPASISWLLAHTIGPGPKLVYEDRKRLLDVLIVAAQEGDIKIELRPQEGQKSGRATQVFGLGPKALGLQPKPAKAKKPAYVERTDLDAMLEQAKIVDNPRGKYMSSQTRKRIHGRKKQRDY